MGPWPQVHVGQMAVALGKEAVCFFYSTEYDQSHLWGSLPKLGCLPDCECPWGPSDVEPISLNGVLATLETCFTCEETAAQGGEMTWTRSRKPRGRRGVGTRSSGSSPVPPAIFINPCARFGTFYRLPSLPSPESGSHPSHLTAFPVFKKRRVDKGLGKVCFRSVKGTDSFHHPSSNARSVPGTGHPGRSKGSFRRLKPGLSQSGQAPGLDCLLSGAVPRSPRSPAAGLCRPHVPSPAPRLAGAAGANRPQEQQALGGELPPRALGRHGNQGGADPWPHGPARPRPAAFPRTTWRRPTRKCRCRRPPGARNRRPGEAEPCARRPAARGPPRGSPAPGRPRPPPRPTPPPGDRPRPRGGAEAQGRRRRERLARGSEAARAAGGSYYRGREEEPGRARGAARGGRRAAAGAARPREAGRRPGLRLRAGELWAAGRGRPPPPPPPPSARPALEARLPLLEAREPPPPPRAGPRGRSAWRWGRGARAPRGGLDGAARWCWAPVLLPRRGDPQSSRAPGLPQWGVWTSVSPRGGGQLWVCRSLLSALRMQGFRN